MATGFVPSGQCDRCIRFEDERHTIQIIPADGWVVKHEWGVQPLVGWALCCDGTVHPLDTDVTGDVLRLGDELRLDGQEIWHTSTLSHAGWSRP